MTHGKVLCCAVLLAAVAAVTCFDQSATVCENLANSPALKAAVSFSDPREVDIETLAPGVICDMCMGALPGVSVAAASLFNKRVGNQGISFEDEEIKAYGAADGRTGSLGAIAYRWGYEERPELKGSTYSHYVQDQFQQATRSIPSSFRAWCARFLWRPEECRARATEICTDLKCCGGSRGEPTKYGLESYYKSGLSVGVSQPTRCDNAQWEGEVPRNDAERAEPLKKLSKMICGKSLAGDGSDTLANVPKWMAENGDAYVDMLVGKAGAAIDTNGELLLDQKNCNQKEAHAVTMTAALIVKKAWDMMYREWNARTPLGLLRSLMDIVAPSGEGQVIDRYCTLYANVMDMGGVSDNDIVQGRVVGVGGYEYLCFAHILQVSGFMKSEGATASKGDFVKDEPSFIRDFADIKDIAANFDARTGDGTFVGYNPDEDWQAQKQRRLEVFRSDKFWKDLFAESNLPSGSREGILPSPRPLKTGYLKLVSNTVGMPMVLPEAREHVNLTARINAKGCLIVKNARKDAFSHKACLDCTERGYKWKIAKEKCMDGIFSSTNHPTYDTKRDCEHLSPAADNTICVDAPHIVARVRADSPKCFIIRQKTGNFWPLRVVKHTYDSNVDGAIELCAPTEMEAYDWAQVINHSVAHPEPHVLGMHGFPQ